MQCSQENACVGACNFIKKEPPTLLKGDSNTGALPWILPIFQEHLCEENLGTNASVFHYYGKILTALTFKHQSILC